MGSATAWKLATRGHHVTLVERSGPAHAGGSSHGSARIFRYTYPDPFYTRLVIEAAEEWSLLEAESGIQLISSTGAVDFGSTRQPAHLASVLDDAGIDNTLLTAERARNRWPQIAFDTDVVWHPGAGVLDPERSVHAMVELAVKSGAELFTDWTVQSVKRAGMRYVVRSSAGEIINTDHVIVCAGAWLPEILGELDLPNAVVRAFPPLEVRQEQAYHFPFRAELSDWPSIIHNRQGMEIYALPGGIDAGYRGMKVAEFNGGEVIGSASRQTGTVDPANRERLVDYVREYLPGLIPKPYAETTCLFTNAPDGDFIIDHRALHLTGVESSNRSTFDL